MRVNVVRLAELQKEGLQSLGEPREILFAPLDEEALDSLFHVMNKELDYLVLDVRSETLVSRYGLDGSDAWEFCVGAGEDTSLLLLSCWRSQPGSRRLPCRRPLRLSVRG
jgi:hypothetical protein